MTFIEQKGTNLLHVGHSRRETGLPFGHTSLWQRTVDTEDIIEPGKGMKCLSAGKPGSVLVVDDRNGVIC